MNMNTTPKGPCSQIDIHRPQSTQIGTTLRPKYIYLDTWTLRELQTWDKTDNFFGLNTFLSPTSKAQNLKQ